ncbi:hypothetical protein BJF80_10460 [Serinicoccus sp. CUA-874]|uniref:hypothetical protein n=1 Tax=Serinicoccus sp. CUA-874 TaxID=1517939 RepID=UPI00095ED996|nr:hypothetical protein [Serinicoccus sp. CUA-874]OLT15282.1 hypothetical protein BJF80_10460 [Serinicoccus sp. CUA-874]
MTDPARDGRAADQDDQQGATGERERGAALLAELGEVSATRSRAERRLLEVAHQLVAATGAALLAQKGFSSVEELTATERRRWRAEAKRLCVAEIRLRLGIGEREARAMTGLACGPVDVRGQVLGALDRAEVTWGLVRGFWDRCGSLPAERAALVAEVLFGTDPATAAVERLDSEGDLREEPWQHADYWATLEREAVRAEGEDVQAERERRRAAYRARRSWLSVHDDGTATLSVTGALTTMSGIHARIEHAARALRSAGDERTLDQLRSDVPAGLLLYGTVPMPEAEVEEDLTLADLAAIHRVTTAQPQVELQVVVPWESLAGRAASDAHGMDTPNHRTALPDRTPRTGAEGDRTPEVSAALDRTPAGSALPDRALAGSVAPDRTAGTDGEHGHLGPVPRLGSVGQVLGHHPVFISPGHARELALVPGTTLSRLLVDPADGRLIERTITRYRPDADMRRQVTAADVHSRSPLTRVPASRCELDHVVPFGAIGGVTGELNLGSLDVRTHQFKTARTWSVTINRRRDLRWCTLLGQSTTTRVHDYRQYLERAVLARGSGAGGHATGGHATGGRVTAGQATAGEATAARPTGGSAADDHPTDSPAVDGSTTQTWESRRDLACQALYAAVVHRGADALLSDLDDDADDGTPLTGWCSVTRRRSDTPVPTPEEVLGLPLPVAEGEQDEQEEHGTTGGTGRGDAPGAPWSSRETEPPPF